MSKDERALPRPPASPFGGKRRFEEREEDVPLMVDRMASAIAAGNLEEFLKEELPDNEQARNLAMMMLGMTGMLPSENLSVSGKRNKDVSKEGTEGRSDPGTEPLPVMPPEDILKAVSAGDVKGLMRLLEREHKKRFPSRQNAAEEKDQAAPPDSSSARNETIERMVRIASENDVAFDWLVLRAFKRYIEEYGRTGLL
jgi:hypothetical protein